MPLRDYGVLAGRAVAKRREGGSDSPHFQVQLVDEDGVDYRIAINVLSQEQPSQLLYLADDDFRHPITEGLPSGWTPLKSEPGAGGLDYIRGNLFDRTRMVPLPPDLPGPENDLADRLDLYMDRAIADPSVTVYVFGQRWGPETKADKIFGFTPGNGVHDVHMNQGNSAAFRRDDGVWQDGGLLLRFPTPQPHWVAVFLAFQSQKWHTDDTTGHALPDGEPAPEPTDDMPVRIVGALVNPVGPAPEAETVTLLNASPEPIGLSGWELADRAKQRTPLPAITLAAGATLSVPVRPPMALSNGGGLITLLDPSGRKVHGVSYTRQQARREGWTVTF